jgi:hypothetical protein
MTPWLSQDEIDDFCKPLTQAAAQIRHLQSQGLTVRKKPNGDALVMRSHFEQVMNPVATSKPAGRREPNRAALIASFAKAA